MNTPLTDMILGLHRDYPRFQRLTPEVLRGSLIAAAKPVALTYGTCIEPRVAYPVSSISRGEISQRWRDYAWVLCKPINTAIVENIGSGCSMVSFDVLPCSCEQLRGSYTYPQPHLIGSTIRVVHERKPVEIIGVGLRLIDAAWEHWYESLIPPGFRYQTTAKRLRQP